MEQQLADSSWNPLSESTTVSPGVHPASVKERDVINRLEDQVDEQRKMRLNDAKQVEAKAAKIKEWVTNKLKDVRSSTTMSFCVPMSLAAYKPPNLGEVEGAQKVKTVQGQ